MLHLLDRRVGWCYARPCAATRAGSNQVWYSSLVQVFVRRLWKARRLPCSYLRCRIRLGAPPVIVFAWMGPACPGIRDSPRCCASGCVMLQSACGMAAEVTGCLEQSEVTCRC